ncbi:hypothetical protein AB1K91_02620 [Terribacillus sp. 179-K 1B1 HS]|uniref:hypothetical protein n=1 Tax=Terribacillus sp. 179-K 1B1 HS TaxID=3142388 RepID=UPI0039A17840
MRYRNPGEGSIRYARDYVYGLSKSAALQVITSLLRGDLHDKSDKRIKTCDYCGYLYRDSTKPNNSKTCSAGCKVARDTIQRQMKREKQALFKPKKRTKRELNYYHWFEYPFWLDEYEMLKSSWKHEAPYDVHKIERIAAAKQRDSLIGGKRKPKHVVPYNGNEVERPKVSVKFGKPIGREPGEVKTYYMDPDEINKYLIEKYGVKKMYHERKRVRNLAAVKRYKGNEVGTQAGSVSAISLA